MKLRMPSLKAFAIALTGLIVVFLAFCKFALPRIIHSQAVSHIAEKSGHRLSFDRPEIGLSDLRMVLPNLRLEDPQGRPLLAFSALEVDLSASSLVRRAFVFDAIRLTEPKATLELLPGGRLNWSPLIEALKDKEEKPDSPLPRLDIQRLVLSDGQLDFSDKASAFDTQINDLDLELTDISTLLDEKGRYSVDARTDFGAHLLWQGQVALNPPAMSGHVSIDGVDLARFAPYLKDRLPVRPPTGMAAVATDYLLGFTAGKLSLVLDNASAQVRNLRLQSPQGPMVTVERIDAEKGSFDLGRERLSLGSLSAGGSAFAMPQAGAAVTLVQLGEFGIEDVQADLASRNTAIGRIALKGGSLKMTRDAHGRFDLVEALTRALPQPANGPKAQQDQAPAAAPWHVKAGKLQLSGFSVELRDEGIAPAVNLALDDLKLAIDHPGDDLTVPLPVEASFRVRSGGSFEARGKVVPAGPAADLELKLVDLALKPAQPYLASVAKLTVADGQLSVQGDASYDKRGPRFKGGFAVRNLRLNETGTGSPFLTWRSLSSRNLAVTATTADLSDLVVNGLDTSLHIARDKTVNMSRIIRQPDEAVPAKPAVPGAPKAGKSAQAFVVNIHRLRMINGELDFVDESLALPFGTRIHRLRGAINGISSRPGGVGRLELEGQVDDYGLARAVGQINLFDPADFTDVKVAFQNVEMNRLTPYSATFAGRKINSGKLSMQLEYKFNKRQLAGDNQIVMDRLVLGERVESPQARDLPLDLAIAILEDSSGRIDLGLPVSGSLDDPQFSYGGIIWKAFLNVLGKIASAPFRSLGALFGGGENLDNIAFEPGRTRLTPPEREKQVRLAEVLNRRPALALTVSGVYADTDRVALQDRQLRRTVAERAGIRLEDKEDPGPLSTGDPKIRSALEKLYADRLGGGELSALKEGFRKANPGQLEEGAAGKMVSRLTGVFREKRSLSDAEVEQLKGTDFHGLLYQRLRNQERIGEERLQALARARAEHFVEGLKAAGVAPERLAQGAPEKTDATGRDVPVKLGLGKVAAPK